MLNLVYSDPPPPPHCDVVNARLKLKRGEWGCRERAPEAWRHWGALALVDPLLLLAKRWKNQIDVRSEIDLKWQLFTAGFRSTRDSTLSPTRAHSGDNKGNFSWRGFFPHIWLLKIRGSAWPHNFSPHGSRREKNASVHSALDCSVIIPRLSTVLWRKIMDKPLRNTGRK